MTQVHFTLNNKGGFKVFIDKSVKRMKFLKNILTTVFNQLDGKSTNRIYSKPMTMNGSESRQSQRNGAYYERDFTTRGGYT